MSFKSLDIEGRKMLVESHNYRDFISNLLKVRSTAYRKYGYADLARSAGFSSRSFPRDVVTGKKNVTLDSCYQFAKGFSLDRELTQYFLYLVELENPTCRKVQKSVEDIKKSLSGLKCRILQEERDLLETQDAPFENLYLPDIYAALGSKERGATLTQIKKRVDLEEGIILQGLEKLIAMKLAEKKDIRYFALIDHVSIQHLNKKTNFKRFYLKRLEDLKVNLDQEYDKAHTLFFSSSFSVSQDKMEDLKEELRSLLLRYVDDNEFADGDKVLRLTCSLR